ncbi:MAG TPA: hypothetical protein VMD75_07975 [Candidatus Binataceae bacterium]|jgi:hypothetical protein|nr:hypothetical protein [Candidatus Binataceae bacterium]
MASGNVEPTRIIEGQKTKLTRVAHGIVYDPVHDEIIATEPLASSIAFFHGDAKGEAVPNRIIQGPKTQLHQPFQVAIDNQHNEIWVADFRTDMLLAYPLDARGDVAPIRMIGGSKSGMWMPVGVAVDPKNNLVVAASFMGTRTWHHNGGLFIFDRTANGNVAPKRVIAGPTTGIIGLWHAQIYDGKIFTTAINIKYLPPYDQGGYAPKRGCDGPPLPWIGPLGFIGVWDINDNGDVAPRAIIRGADTDLIHPGGLVLDPGHGEVFASDSNHNGYFGFLVPSFFQAATF